MIEDIDHIGSVSFAPSRVLYFLPVAHIMPVKFPAKDLFFARAYYFSFMGGWGFVLPFVNLFYVSVGLSGTQIGTVASLSAIVSLVLSPVVVTEIKKLPKARMILQLCLIMGAIGYFLLGQQTVFLAILIVIFFQTIATSAILPTSDAMAVSVAQDHETGYGSIRLWASVGWIIIVLSAGWLIERSGYQAGFTGVAIMWTIGAGLLLFIRSDYFVARIGIDVSKPSVRAAIQRVLQDRTLIGFAVTVILVGFLNNGVLQFENVFLSQLGATKQLIAVAGILSAIVEVPFMAYADRFVRRVGAHRVMLIALVMISFQRAAVLLLPYIATIMIVRFIGGISFSFYTISYVGLISSRTRATETGTVLALYSVTLAGLVNMLAAPVSGSIFDAIGARWLYALAVTGYGLGALVLWLTRPAAEKKTDPSLSEGQL
jgi:MFS transporter, PPP family, 3-phenylpropionic acid transporter